MKTEENLEYKQTTEDKIQSAQSTGFHYPEGICCRCGMEEDKCECRDYDNPEISDSKVNYSEVDLGDE